uniref:nuclear transport factor 2 family protein n=1 Tax=Paractinoplanes polyasparticus TaxID=2856853 RepID=UPI0034DB709B
MADQQPPDPGPLEHREPDRSHGARLLSRSVPEGVFGGPRRRTAAIRRTRPRCAGEGRSDARPAYSHGMVTPAARLIDLEKRRLRALVDADAPTLDALHADDFVLIHPGGGVWSRAEYLGGINSGVIDYRRFEAVSDRWSGPKRPRSSRGRAPTWAWPARRGDNTTVWLARPGSPRRRPSRPGRPQAARISRH